MLVGKRRIALLILVAAFSLTFLIQYSSELYDLSQFNSSSYTLRTTIKSTPFQIDRLQDHSWHYSRINSTNDFAGVQWRSVDNVTPGIHLFRDRIDTIRIIGERHSGTTYLSRYIAKCFPDQGVSNIFIRGKHWFQPTPQTIIETSRRFDKHTLTTVTMPKRFDSTFKSWWDIANDPNPKGVFQTSLVLYLVRDPYQWMEAMRRKPWHWPNHIQLLPNNETNVVTMKYEPNKETNLRDRRRRRLQRQKSEENGEGSDGPIQIQKSFVRPILLDWRDFVESPMSLQEKAPEVAGDLCQKGFLNGTVSPCVQNNSYVPFSVQSIPPGFLRNLPFAANNVVYELRQNGDAFEHPLALRAAKIRNALSLVQDWELGGFALLRYEDILGGDDNGTSLSLLVEEIATALGVENKCPPHKPVKKTPYIIGANFSDWIDRNADWTTEGLVRYMSSKLTSSRINTSG